MELDRGGQNNYVYTGEPKTVEVGDDATVTGVNLSVKKPMQPCGFILTSTGAPLDKLNFFAEARKDGADFGRGGIFGARDLVAQPRFRSLRVLNIMSACMWNGTCSVLVGAM